MKIFITADIHLKDRADAPERYHALENILMQADEQNVENIIIAGDLFDQIFRNYGEFERLCANYHGIQLHIIPGNHDSGINEKIIVAPNIHIYTETVVREIGSVVFVFIPYKHESSMAEQLNIKREELAAGEWILIGHGDYFGNKLSILNTYEPGTYMPLSKNNIQEYRPKRVFLGHIHKPFDMEKVHYSGSPCGLDITETGVRRLLEYDCDEDKIIPRKVKSDFVYFDERIFVFPHDDECRFLSEEIDRRIQSWNIEKTDEPNVILRISAMGYAKDRAAISGTLKKGFSAYKFYLDQEPSIENLNHSTDDQLNAIALRALDSIDKTNWELGDEQPDKELVKIHALKTIYESGS